ncbi:MAG: YqzL family protein [Clostridia bacterium]|nr:YqzL family protein [Clostridia bacterium]
MKKPEDMAWQLFEKTGKTGYYMLYKKLSQEDKRSK